MGLKEKWMLQADLQSQAKEKKPELKVQGCETGVRADSPQAAEQGYTQLWRETSAGSNLASGKKEEI